MKPDNRVEASTLLLNAIVSTLFALTIVASNVCCQEDTTVVDYLSIEGDVATGDEPDGQALSGGGE